MLGNALEKSKKQNKKKEKENEQNNPTNKQKTCKYFSSAQLN